MENHKTNKYFDEGAVAYNTACERDDSLRSFIFSERKKIVLDMLDIKKGRILDVGCGPGSYTDRLSQAGYDVYGVDSSEKMLEIARNKKFKNVNFSVCSAGNLQFENSFFDGVLCVGVLEYLDNVEEAVKDIARVTKHGGIVIFTAPNGTSLLNMLDLLMRGVIKSVYKITKIVKVKKLIDYEYESKLFFRKKLKLILEKNGFKIELSKFHIFRLSFLNRISPKLSLLIAKKMNFISSPFFGVNYIVRCRKSSVPLYTES